ncbi:MAG: EAL domain-containing protein, partial [Limnobacter sp.]|nr:EAL domain-containing protein [Limnobacter sp.]
SLMMLAVFTALVSGRAVFLLYSIWLVASLRVCLLASGLDAQFFGIELPLSWVPRLRSMALTVYFATTFSLATELFPNARQAVWQPLRQTIWLGLVVLSGFAMWGEYATFLQLLWPLAVFASVVTLAIAAHGVLRSRSTSMMLYVIGISALLLVALGDILSVWLDWGQAQFVNGEIIALFASWMLVISVLEAQRQARQARRSAEIKAQAIYQRMSVIFDLAPSPMFSVNASGRICTFNSSFKQLKKKLDSPEFLQPRYLENLWAQVSTQGKQWVAQYHHINSVLQTCWYEMSLVPNGRELIGSLRDITAEKDRESQLHFQVTHDEMTGALNRRGLDERLRHHLESGCGHFDLILFDIKRFRQLVKAHGLAVADRILEQVYLSLCRHLNSFGDLARIGYDQFLLLHTRPDQKVELQATINRCLDGLRRRPVQVEGLQALTRVQAALLEVDLDLTEKTPVALIEDLVNEMKIRLDRESATLQVFDSVQAAQMLEFALLGKHILSQGLPDNLTLMWQPILGIQNQKPGLYAEALLRQVDKNGKVVSGASVLTTCHNRGQTALLDKWVLTQTLDFLKANHARLKELKTVAVNVSPLSLNDEAFLAEVLVLLQSSGELASRICLEVTEVGTILNPGSVKAFMLKVKNLGVTVGLDDFGAGFSNFQYALDLQADVIKIDGTIAGQVCKNLESRSVVNAIVTLARDLGCVTVGEWVENRFTLEELRDLGVDYVQGYLISPALHPEEFFDKQSCQDFYSLA